MAKPVPPSAPQRPELAQSTDSQAAALTGIGTQIQAADDAERASLIKELWDAARESNADAAGLRIRGYHDEADVECDHARAFRMAARFLEESAKP